MKQQLRPDAFPVLPLTHGIARRFTLVCVCVFLAMLIFPALLSAQQLSRVKIYIPHNKISKLRDAGIEFDHGYYDFAENSFTNSFEAADVPKIARLGLRYEVLAKDEAADFLAHNSVADFYKNDNSPVTLSGGRVNSQANCQSYTTFVNTPVGFTSGSRAGFYTWPEMQARMDSMVNNYPGLVTKTQIGTTFLGNPMYVIKISDNAAYDDPTEPEVLFTGLHHAREGMSGMNLIFFMQYLLENYSSNAQVKELVDNRQLYFVPIVNVDGYNYNTTAANWNAGSFLRRKNMRNTGGTPAADGSGGYGVDLNRNYAKYFNYNTTGSSGTITSDAYRGPSAFSEPETQAMRAFVNGRRFNLAVNYHCYGNWWIRPNGPAAVATALPQADLDVYTGMANLFTKYNGFVFGNASQTVYEVNGYSDDWFFSDDLTLRKRVFAFSPEIGSSAESFSGSSGFWAQTANIIPIAKKMLFSNFQIAYTGGGYAELQDTSDVVVKTTTGNFGYTVTRKGLVDTPVTVTMIPLENIQTAGSPVTISSIPVFLGTSSGKIAYTLPSGIAAGSRIRYVWKTDVGGISLTDTIVKFYNPSQVFADDMETTGNFAAKWTTSGTGTWGYTTTQAFQGTRALNQSPGANYAANSDQSVTLKTALDLSSSNAAYLSFMLRYDAENQQDRMQLEVSTTGTSGSFAPICGQNTIKENYNSLGNNPAYTGHADGWMRELIDLSSYTGNNNVAFRFRFLSGPSSSEVTSPVLATGFFVDNLKVVKTNLSLLPVQWLEFNAQRSGDASVISWKAEADNKFLQYQLQRSADGITFQTVAVLSQYAGTSYIDETPFRGINYYRVKAVDVNGVYSFSKTAAVNFPVTATAISYYPNPVRDLVNVVVPQSAAETLSFQVSSLTGQVLYTEKKQMTEGSNRVQINLAGLSNGMYVLKIMDKENLVKSVFKIVKK